MRINGYPSQWNRDEGLQPIELQDIVFAMAPSELRKLSTFFIEAADQAEKSGKVTQSITLSDSKPNAKTGMKIVVICE